MKFINLRITAAIVIVIFCSIKAHAQANVNLSNLGRTLINQNLSPGTNNLLWLGSGSATWRRLYLSDAVYLGTSRFLSAGLDGTPPTAAVTSVGVQALSLNSTGTFNTATGYQALFKNTAGNSNTAVGSSAMNENTTGSNNSGFGVSALGKNSTGSWNTAVGFESMLQCSSCYNSTAIGTRSLYWNLHGGANTAIGMESLFENDNGGANTAAGSRALYLNTSGNNNTAVGANALSSNDQTSGNTVMGAGALQTMTVGNGGNVVVGYQAVSTGNFTSYATAVGYQAMYASNNGPANTAIGYQALYAATTAPGNTSIGMHSQRNNTTGTGNVSAGMSSLYNITTGNYNTAIGSYADVGNGALNNATSIGYLALATASNQIMLGNSSVTSVKASGSYVLVSDGRFKNDVRANVPGLEFINELRPVTYHYNVKGMNALTGVGEPRKKQPSNPDGNTVPNTAGMSQNGFDEAAIATKEQKLYTGFVAQEVETAAKKHNFDFSGIYRPANDKDLYGLSYSDFVVPLVKAVQELSKANDSLKATNDSISVRLHRLESAVFGTNSSGTSLSDASLGNNQPNPFHGSTTIHYFLPVNYGRAKLQIADISGRIIKTIGVSGSGKCTLNVDGSSLSPGIYTYTLYVDEKVIGTEKMMVSK